MTAGEGVLGATAARNRELTRTVRALPGFLSTLRGTLGEADATVREAAPTLRTLRPAAPALEPALAAGLRFGPSLESFLRDLRPAAHRTGQVDKRSLERSGPPPSWPGWSRRLLWDPRHKPADDDKKVIGPKRNPL